MSDANNQTTENKTGRRLKRAGLVLLIIALVCGAGLAAYELARPKVDPGAIVAEAPEDMTDEEIQAMLDEQVKANMMDISCASEPALEGDTLGVRVTNPESNKFNQRFEVEQDGRTLYISGIIKPGEMVETCDAPGAHAGDATIRIVAVDGDTGNDHGNPVAVAVSIVDAE